MERLGRVHRRRGLVTPIFVAGAVTLVVAAALGAVWFVQSHTRGLAPAVAAEAQFPSGALASADGSSSEAASASADATASTVDIEVPPVTGKDVKVAEALVTAAGLSVQTRVADPPVSGASPDTVLSQWPAAGALVQTGSRVVITYQPRVGASVSATGTPVVVIDPGHQAKADLALEPIGPGSKTAKPKVAGGATGVATHVPEYERALEISLALRDALVAQGVRVVMVRTANNVDIPNSKRARIGNAAKADLVVRVHLDSTTDGSVHGVSTLFPTGNRWVTAIEASSRAAAHVVETSVAQATGEVARGIFGRSDMSGFNYSTRPTIIVECGFMSNASEDRVFASGAYRQKVANGIATGVMAFLRSR